MTIFLSFLFRPIKSITNPEIIHVLIRVTMSCVKSLIGIYLNKSIESDEEIKTTIMAL